MRRTNLQRILKNLSPAEVAVVDRMREAGGFTSDLNLVISALWSLADDMCIDMPDGVFDHRNPHVGSAKHCAHMRDVLASVRKAKHECPA